MSYNVLIVEDTIDIAALVEIALQQMGMSTHHCKDAHVALEFLDEIHPEYPDLILLDIGMPGMTGWEFLEIIKQHGYMEKVRVIVTTAYGDPANRVVGRLQEVDAYLTKPFGPLDIQAVVTKVMGGQ